MQSDAVQSENRPSRALRRAGLLAVLGLGLACAGARAGGPGPGAAAQPNPAAAQASTQTLPRIGLVALNVFDLNRSLDFYVRKLGMTEQRRIAVGGGVSETILGFGDAASSAGLILMFNEKRQQPYQQGDAFSRLVLRVAGLEDLVKRLAADGVAIVRPPTAAANLNLTYALIRDPDGYLIEFIQTR